MAAVGKIGVPIWIVVASLLAGCGQEEVDFRQIQDINGLAYKLGENEPFTGVIKNYPINALGVYTVGSCSVELDVGLPDGTTTCMSNDGIKVAESRFSAGRKDGPEKRWNAQSQNLTHELNWVAGYQEGAQREYYPGTGLQKAEIEMVKGKVEGIEKRWAEDGETVTTDLVWRNGKKTGMSSNIESITNYLDGEPHGEQKYFSRNQGEWYLRNIEHYEAGARIDSRSYDEASNLTEETLYKNGIVQQRLSQTWEEGVISSRRFEVTTNPDWSERWEDPPLVKDGLEKYCDHLDTSCYEIEWAMGRPVKARFEFRNLSEDTIEVEYEGVPTSDGSLVKHGKEIYSSSGYRTELQWNRGELQAGYMYSLRRDEEQAEPISTTGGQPDFFIPSGCYECLIRDRYLEGDPG